MFRSFSRRVILWGLLAIITVPGQAAVSAAQTAGPPDVVVTVKPLHALVAAVMGDVGSPHLLVSGAANPHAFALKPSDARALSSAELVVWVGPQLEAFLEKPLAALADKATILTLARVQTVRNLPARQGGSWAKADGETALDRFDGHIWLDPLNAQAIVAVVADELARLDPARAATYRANAKAVRMRLDALHRELDGMLAPVRSRPFIVFHDAYRHLEERYGLNAVGSLTVSPERRPGAARLAELRARIQELGAVCVFSEPQFEASLVRTLVEGTTARTGILDPEGANLPSGPELYATLLRQNAQALVDCLG